jgi:excisionase family DNA binding protein
MQTETTSHPTSQPSMPPPTRELLTIMRACARVGVSRRTIYNWITSGKLEYVRTAGGSIRIYADTLFRRV